MKIYSRDTNRWIDWPSATALWRAGYDTKAIASLLWIHESVIYNNLGKLKAAPNGMARAS